MLACKYLVSGAPLQEGLEYAFATNTVTFLIPINDAFDIQIDYFVTTTPPSSVTVATGEYATTLELAKHMQMLGDTVDGPSNTFIETVGVGNSSQTTFLLDHKGIIADNYTLYYGATPEASLATPLTETTHYTLDKDTGIITLTSAGVTLLSTNNLYASYKYNTAEKPESELQNAINRATARVDMMTYNHFCDGTADTPDYIQILDEEHTGRGLHSRDYFSHRKPVANVHTTLNGALSPTSQTITVTSTQGFAESGYIGIDSMKITYTGKTDTTFTGCSGVSVAALDGTTVTSYVFEASNSIEGVVPVWTVLKKDDDYNLSPETGRVRLMETNYNITDALAWGVSPPQRVPGRFRMSYLQGENTIPDDIKLATLMLASNDLMHGQVRRATVGGFDNFQARLIDVDLEQIKMLLRAHTNNPMGRTA
jgi:hypothetical protein